MSRIDAACGRLATRLKERAGRAVIYIRNAGRADERRVPITAIVAQRMSTVATAEQQTGRLDGTVRDWIVTAADLVIGGRVVLPEIGDRLRESGGVIWEVFPLDSEKGWRPCDGTDVLLRLHTKRVD